MSLLVYLQVTDEGILFSLALVWLIFGVVSFTLIYGFYRAKGWAWVAGMIMSFASMMYIAIIGFLPTLGVLEIFVSIIISVPILALNALIIFYLNKATVREYFGKGPKITF